MMIWLLAILLLASLAGLGFRQGAIRVGISFIGILLGALLAPPLGRLLRPVLMAVGVKNPILLWLLGLLIIFVLISALFKLGIDPIVGSKLLGVVCAVLSLFAMAALADRVAPDLAVWMISAT